MEEWNPFDIVLGKLIVLIIKFHLVSIVKPLDVILNFDLVLPLLYHKLLFSSQYALLNIERPTKYYI
jgi:hypothetical protein